MFHIMSFINLSMIFLLFAPTEVGAMTEETWQERSSQCQSTIHHDRTSRIIQELKMKNDKMVWRRRPGRSINIVSSGLVMLFIYLPFMTVDQKKKW